MSSYEHDAPKHDTAIAKPPAKDDAPIKPTPPKLEPKDLAMLAATMAGGTVANHGGTLPPEVAAKLVAGAKEILVAATAAAVAKPEATPAKDKPEGDDEEDATEAGNVTTTGSGGTQSTAKTQPPAKK